MPKGLIDKIKRTIIEGGTTAASKVEETARYAKVKLDLVAEENRLNSKYSDFGELVYDALQAGNLNSITEDQKAVELTKSIGENLAKIEDIKAKLKALQETCCPPK